MCEDTESMKVILKALQIHLPDDINSSVLCGTQNESSDIGVLGDHRLHEDRIRFKDLGLDVYAYCTPVIILVGLLGNSLSLKVFTSKVMSRLSSSFYLLALSVADMLVLLTYGIDWLNHGLVRWPGNYQVDLKNYTGACQLFMYLNNIFRLMSSWFIVLFTVERYLAVCWPTFRKRLCTRTIAKRVTFVTSVVACLLCIYKPLMSGVTSGLEKERVCTRRHGYDHASFVLDGIYGICITAVPSLVIVVLNMPILCRLVRCDGLSLRTRMPVKESKIRLEFTVILLTISPCFICLSVPYFVTWCIQFTQSLWPESPSAADHLSGMLHICRTLFCMKYSINFLLYIMAGAYYRREIRSVFRYYMANEASERTNSQNV